MKLEVSDNMSMSKWWQIFLFLDEISIYEVWWDTSSGQRCTDDREKVWYKIREDILDREGRWSHGGW